MNKPKALYIHIPFCEHICAYCDFPKLQYFYDFAKNYLAKLKDELITRDVNKELDTIYIGGGTPTSLSDDLFLGLLKTLSPYTQSVKEYTIEANPESLSEEKIILMKKYGVNRVSIGVESTDDKILSLLNRHHTFQDVKNAVSSLKKHKIDNYNLDLIIGLPHVHIDQIKIDLANLISLEPKHISVYSLTVHENTMFFNQGVKEENEDVLRQYYDVVHQMLEKHGYIHYEVSNWCKPNYQSIHNLTYWRNLPYYGVGLGASGYIDSVRYTNNRNITAYNKGIYKGEEEILSNEDIYKYQVMTNLRTNEGLNLNYVKEQFGIDLLKEKGQIIAEYVANKLLINKDNTLLPTYEGMMVLDAIILDLF